MWDHNRLLIQCLFWPLWTPGMWHIHMCRQIMHTCKRNWKVGSENQMNKEIVSLGDNKAISIGVQFQSIENGCWCFYNASYILIACPSLVRSCGLSIVSPLPSFWPFRAEKEHSPIFHCSSCCSKSPHSPLDGPLNVWRKPVTQGFPRAWSRRDEKLSVMRLLNFRLCFSAWRLMFMGKAPDRQKGKPPLHVF